MYEVVLGLVYGDLVSPLWVSVDPVRPQWRPFEAFPPKIFYFAQRFDGRLRYVLQSKTWPQLVKLLDPWSECCTFRELFRENTNYSVVFCVTSFLVSSERHVSPKIRAHFRQNIRKYRHNMLHTSIHTRSTGSGAEWHGIWGGISGLYMNNGG